MSRRTEMLGSTIQRELASIIMREISDPRVDLMISITRVSVSEDLGVADVYVSIMGTPGQQTAALNALKHSAGLMRTKLTKSLTMRQTPYLKFHIDERLKKELETLDLLERVRLEQEQTDRERAERRAAEEAALRLAVVSDVTESAPAAPVNNSATSGESLSKSPDVSSAN